MTNTGNIKGPIASINPERNKVVPVAGLCPVSFLQRDGMVILLLIVNDNDVEAFPYPEKIRRTQVWQGIKTETKWMQEQVVKLPYGIITIY